MISFDLVASRIARFKAQPAGQLARRWPRSAFTLALLATLMFVAGQQTAMARACPFCSAQSQTLSEEITAMDAAVLATLESIPPRARDSDEVMKAKFKIVQVIKGEKLLGKKTIVETVYFGDAKVGKKFFITGVGPENIQWSTPLPLSAVAEKYIAELPKLPKAGAERLEYFQKFLENSDELLARDAYDEFAKSPYEVVQALKPKMNHDQLVTWIKDTNVVTSRRRLYLTLLGVCGSEKDVSLLETMLLSEDRKQRAGLDALIACYLILKGPEGLPLVEKQFIQNAKAEYADTYAAIMALRFHGNDVKVIPKERVVASLRLMLDRPNLADLVIPDLARWEDWESMDKLVNLFKQADEKTSWVKVPVVNFLRACPLPEAKNRIKELEKLDPESVKRANTFFPFPTGSAPNTPAKS
ncbi:MAG: hypothetical protein ACKOUR_07960 [Planctomycetota bacterium]